MAKRKKTDLTLVLSDEQLIEKLQSAATAIGLESPEQLADLVLDSGVTARPPVDGLTERFTLEDLGVRLWTKASATVKTERVKWFARLAPTHKIAVVTTLKHRGYASLRISNDLGLTEMEVEQIWAESRTKLGAQVLGVRLDTLVGSMMAAKQRAQEGAAEKNDWATYWRIEDAYLNRLQELGVVDRAAHKMEIVKDAGNAKQATLDKLNEIAEKRARRMMELKTLEDNAHEPLPEEVSTSYEELKDG